MGDLFKVNDNNRVRGITGPHRIKGVPYGSLGEACVLLGFEYNTIYNRMARDASLTAEDAMYNFESKMKTLNAVAVEFNGKPFASYTELCKHTQISSPQSLSRLHRESGLPIELLVYANSIGYKRGQLCYFEGNLYVSYQHLCESHGFKVNNVMSIQKHHGFTSFYDAFLYYITNIYRVKNP